MFERFTDRARRCIYFARQSAAGYGSQTIETEHFLLAVLHEDPNGIGRFLPLVHRDALADVARNVCRNKAVKMMIHSTMETCA